jgi:1,4-dihydroxy-2-naphthoate octaprenyltransferase
MSVREALAYAVATGLVAVVCGVSVVAVRGGPTVWLLLTGAFFVLFYTWPLKHLALGEAAVLMVWGPLMIGGGYFAVTGDWDWPILLAALPYGLGATSVILGKHIDKLEADRAKAIHTLPVVLGERWSRRLAMITMVGQYVTVGGLIAGGRLGAPLALCLIGVPDLIRAMRIYAKPRPTVQPPGYPASVWPLWCVSYAFVHNRAFGLGFVLGLAADVAVRNFAR